MSTAAAVDLVQPLHVFAWIVDSGLRDSLKALAHSILRRVDRESWRWPRRPGDQGGITVADLADGAGLSRRHAARCLRELEEMGLVRTIFRPFEVSEYVLLPESWRQKAESWQTKRKAKKAAERQQRIEAFNARREEHLARCDSDPDLQSPSPSAPSSPPPGPVTPPPSAEPPEWARKAGKRLKAHPRTILEIVGGATAAVLGDAVDRPGSGGWARSVLRLWEARGRPPEAVLTAEVALIAQWAKTSVDPEAISLRGEGRRGDGIDRSQDPRQLLDTARWEVRLEKARRHEAARHSVEEEPPAQARAGPEIPLRGQPPWVAPGQPSPRRGPVTRPEELLRDAIRAACFDPNTMAALGPLKLVGSLEGILVLEVESQYHGAVLAQHYAADLARLGEAAQMPIGLVAPV